MFCLGSCVHGSSENEMFFSQIRMVNHPLTQYNDRAKHILVKTRERGGGEEKKGKIEI